MLFKLAYIFSLIGICNQRTFIRLILQGTVDINLGPDRLAGTKALDPNYCRQPTLWLHDLCLEVLTVHCSELRLFGAKAFPLLILSISRIWHSTGRYNFKFFSYDSVGADYRTQHLPNDDERYATCYATDFANLNAVFFGCVDNTFKSRYFIW